MSIAEDYVSFETAKLLKEKGFDEPVEMLIRKDGTIYHADTNSVNKKRHIMLRNSEINMYSTDLSCPTLQMAMKWLRETHNLHICIEPHSFSKNNKPIGYECTYWFNGSFYYPYAQRSHPLEYKIWDTYEDAVIETIKYCLTEL